MLVGHTDESPDTDCAYPTWAFKRLSAVVFLSSPDEYIGGSFELQADGHLVSLRPQRGSMLIFRAQQLLHRVAPVTGGTRRTLVMWAGSASEQEQTFTINAHLDCQAFSSA